MIFRERFGNLQDRAPAAPQPQVLDSGNSRSTSPRAAQSLGLLNDQLMHPTKITTEELDSIGMAADAIGTVDALGANISIPTGEEIWDSVQHRFWRNHMAEDMVAAVGNMENNTLRDSSGGAGGLSSNGFHRDLSPEYCDLIIEEELRGINGHEADGLTSFCVGCGCAKPTFLLVTEDSECRHLVYCDNCAKANSLQSGSDHLSVPAHMWAEVCQLHVRCPLCRREGRLIRIWRPEEAGGWNGMCLVCGTREARNVVFPCRHLCCCEDCKHSLTIGTTEDGHPMVECPACHEVGFALKVFVP